MDYGIVEKGFFKKRINRFTAIVSINGDDTVCHVKNTGRLGELLLPDAVVYLKYCDAETRKTQYDLISVESRGQIVNIDSQATNKVFGEWVGSGIFAEDLQLVKPEFTYGDSRFDFKLGYSTDIRFVEIKGVTLLRDGIAYFPDAPTERGIKHIHGLIDAVEHGYKAAIFFVIQMKGCRALRPNDETQPAFGAALREAAAAGVEILAYDSLVTPNTLSIDAPVSVQI